MADPTPTLPDADRAALIAAAEAWDGAEDPWPPVVIAARLVAAARADERKRIATTIEAVLGHPESYGIAAEDLEFAIRAALVRIEESP